MTEREFERYLEGGSRLSRAYRDTGGEMPPASIDRAVREAVVRERANTDALRRRTRRWHHYLVPMAAAATVLLSFSLVMQLVLDPVIRGVRVDESVALSEDAVPAATIETIDSESHGMAGDRGEAPAVAKAEREESARAAAEPAPEPEREPARPAAAEEFAAAPPPPVATDDRTAPAEAFAAAPPPAVAPDDRTTPAMAQAEQEPGAEAPEVATDLAGDIVEDGYAAAPPVRSDALTAAPDADADVSGPITTAGRIDPDAGSGPAAAAAKEDMAALAERAAPADDEPVAEPVASVFAESGLAVGTDTMQMRVPAIEDCAVAGEDATIDARVAGLRCLIEAGYEPEARDAIRELIADKPAFEIADYPDLQAVMEGE